VTRSLPGWLFRLAGGLLLVAGFLWPELGVAARRLVADGDIPWPDRSHWFVLGENLAMVSEPDDSLPGWFTVWYGVQTLGLVWFCAAGLLIAAAALLRARVAAALLGGAHAMAWSLLAAGVAWVFGELPPAGDGQEALVRGWHALLLAALALGQAAHAWRSARLGGWWRFNAVDRAQLLPLVVLFLTHAGCFIGLRGHPNWPAGGYLVGAIGGALALVGTVRAGSPRP
jgi:hypothetical protein